MGEEKKPKKTRAVRRNNEGDYIKFKNEKERKEALIRYAKMFLNGDSIADITQCAMREYNIPSEKTINTVSFLNQVKDYIAESVAENDEEIVKVHAMIYEEVYRRFMYIGYEKGALKTLKQKEKLLGMIPEETQEVIMNNQVNVEVQSQGEIYDYSKLSDKELKRLNMLINKTTTTNKKK